MREYHKRVVRVTPQLYRTIKTYTDGAGRDMNWNDCTVALAKMYGTDKIPGRKTIAQIGRSSSFEDFREAQQLYDAKLKSRLEELKPIEQPVVEEAPTVDGANLGVRILAELITNNDLLARLVDEFHEAWGTR